MPFAQHSASSIQDSVNILLTDQPQLWLDFPGELVDISNHTLSESYIEFEQQNRELRKVAGGYWLNTLKRLFVLDALLISPYKWIDMVHYESDVYPLLTPETLECMRQNITTTGVPRFSTERGIASLLYIKNRESLIDFIESISVILTEEKSIKDDMELLGLALNKGMVEELPTIPEDSWKWKGRNYVFDGAAYGQYLFGQDPFHTNGKIISGYQNPDFPVDLTKGKWGIKETTANRPSINFTYADREYEIANLHVHSKIALRSISKNDRQWSKYIQEANGETPRIAITISETSVHSERIPLQSRFLIAKKKGLIRSIKRKVQNYLTP
jgi:hypothetical protein